MKTDHDLWASYWRNALDNMPYRKPSKQAEDKDYSTIDGRWGGLARVLGYKMYSTGGHYIGHQQTYNNLCRGSVPKSPLAQYRLKALAGHHGKLLAWMYLTKLGIAHRYIKPQQW